MNNEVIISIQVINELSNVLRKKFNIELKSISAIIDELSKNCKIEIINLATVFEALKISERYGYSYYDSLIISSAIENGCSILFSEDLQDGQNIDDKLKIINPFK